MNKFYILQQIMRKKGLKPSTKNVAYELINHWNYKTRTCYPSEKYLADKLGVSLSTITVAAGTGVTGIGGVFVSRSFSISWLLKRDFR